VHPQREGSKVARSLVAIIAFEYEWRTRQGTSFIEHDLSESFSGLKIISFYITKISLWQLYLLGKDADWCW